MIGLYAPRSSSYINNPRTVYSEVMDDRFIKQDDVDRTKAEKEQEWKQVHGDEKPPEVLVEKYDPRTLYERLKEQEELKEAEFQEKIKLANHFRPLNRDELGFYQELKDAEREKDERTRKEVDDALEKFKELSKNEKRESAPSLAFTRPKKRKQVAITGLIKKQKETESSLGKDPLEAKRKKSEGAQVSSSKNGHKDSATPTIASTDASETKSKAAISTLVDYNDDSD